MGALFISHSSHDDAFVRELQQALADHDQDVWIDSRGLRGGDLLSPEIHKALDASSAYALVLSADALQSKWVGKELRLALELSRERGRDAFPIILISLDGTRLGVLEELLGEEPVYIPVRRGAGGVDAAIHDILVALGRRLPTDMPAVPQPKAEPIEELVLHLSDLEMHEQDGSRRATARARLACEPAAPGKRSVMSAQSWRVVAPLGPIETQELRWYLEQYAVWPSQYFRSRAAAVEENLVKWGHLLHEAALPASHCEQVMRAWHGMDALASRRFSVHVDVALDASASDADRRDAREAAALLLALPWELLHDGSRFLFQGAKPTRVRRTLPGTEPVGVAVVATPIRILRVTARPEDEVCGYIDHRASALPLVEAMEALPGMVHIHALSPPTLPALAQELDRARASGQPYHVLHFDGHGVYDRTIGLGGLCFEHAADVGLSERRRHVTVFTNELGPLLRDHRIPLVFLDACQTAQTDRSSESVASELLKVGVASVVAMSHSVLVETARRFVEAFYRSLAGGSRVGTAMLAGQRRLKDDPSRGRVFGAGELRLEDWFVPVLFQEKEDLQLFTVTASRQTIEDFQQRLQVRLGELPATPDTGFVGRSRELLALERRLQHERYVVIRGQGGEGKTALAAEFARWMIRSQQIRRAAFVSVETHGDTRAMVDSLGRQIVGRRFTAAGDLDAAMQQVERALREQDALLVVDNMESVLLPPLAAQEGAEALSEDTRESLAAILAMCLRLVQVGGTRIVFTSREWLPAPFDGRHQRLELRRLHVDDAVKLVERALDASGADAGAPADAARDEIEQLVGAVHGHARTLALLAPSLRTQGVSATRHALVALMTDMERRFPGDREHSLLASVALSLNRMSAENRARVRVLAPFHGGAHLGTVKVMTDWEFAEVDSLANELVESGLATRHAYGHIAFVPALCPFLAAELNETERALLTNHWVAAMLRFLAFLSQQQSQNTNVSTTLTVLELPNLFAMLEHLKTLHSEATIEFVSTLYRLLAPAGKPRLLERLAQMREATTASLDDSWSHAQFQSWDSVVDEHLTAGRLREALDESQRLLTRARSAGEHAYPHADYDLATALFKAGRVLKMTFAAEQALPLLDEARQRYDAVAQQDHGNTAAHMAAVCVGEQGACLQLLGRLDAAAAAFENSLERSEQLGNARQVAVCKGQLGSIRLDQGRHDEALAAYAEARTVFTQLGEPASVATTWHQAGRVHHEMRAFDAAEHAYREALAIRVRLRDAGGEASALGQLGILYGYGLERLEDAAVFFRQALHKYVELQDVANEGRTRNNLARILRRLGRMDEARQEIRLAIECDSQFGHATEPWKSWDALALIEADRGDHEAAAEAKRSAVSAFLAYRRDGGENHHIEGRIAHTVAESLLAGDTSPGENDGPELQDVLEDLWVDPRAIVLRPFLHVMRAIVAGSRDCTLADEPDLSYTMAAEVLLLIDTLNAEGA